VRAPRAADPYNRDMRGEPFATDVPGQLDRQRWSRFHTLLIAALGTGNRRYGEPKKLER
jgi:hypothetical protein